MVSGKNEPRQASVNGAIDLTIDTAQNLKNFINNQLDNVIDAGQEGKDDINKLLDDVINKLQDLKG